MKLPMHMNRKDLTSAERRGDNRGARTFLSAAAPEPSTALRISSDLFPHHTAADRNVRTPGLPLRRSAYFVCLRFIPGLRSLALPRCAAALLTFAFTLS